VLQPGGGCCEGRDIPGEKRLLEPSADDEDVPWLSGEGLDWERRGHDDLMVLRVEGKLQ